MARRSLHLIGGGLLVLLTVVSCSSADDVGGTAAPTTAGPDIAEGTDAPAVPGLPGDEALTPPPPDSAAAEHLALLSGVPAGTLTGHLSMTVSGLAAFDEDVTGTCSRPDGLPVFRAALSDGSTWEVAFGTDGATSTLAAPGIQVEQQLREADVSVSDRVVVGARLLTSGTSESSGRVDVDFTCA